MNKDTLEKKKEFHKEYIKTPEFEEVKQAVFERDGHKCVCCQRTDKLVCHHTGYRHLGQHNQAEVDDCVTLCVHCHAMGLHRNPANTYWFSVDHPRNCDDLREVDGVLVRSNGEDFYDASTFKRLKIYKNKNRNNRGRVIMPGEDGKQEYTYVLVAKAFPEVCGVWFEGCHVHHLNRDTQDDRAENLRVMSVEEHHAEHLEELISATREASSKRTAQYTLSGNLIAVYSSSIEAAEAMNIAKSAIRNVTSGASNTSCGYVWKTFEDGEEIPEFIPPVKSVSERLSEAASKPILQYDKKGNLVREWKSARQATEALGLKSHSTICNCLKGKNKTAGGFVWKYKYKDKDEAQ